jgi:hypothetical protein
VHAHPASSSCATAYAIALVALQATSMPCLISAARMAALSLSGTIETFSGVDVRQDGLAAIDDGIDLGVDVSGRQTLAQLLGLELRRRRRPVAVARKP